MSSRASHCQALSRDRPSLFGMLCLLGLLLAFSLAGCADSAGDGASRAAAGRIDLPKTRLRVRVDTVRLDHLAAGNRVTGTVRAYHRAVVTSEAQGRVLSRKVEPGAHIEAGATIVLLEASRFDLELRRAEASLAAARTVLAHAKREFARGEQLLSRKAISTQQHDDLRNGVYAGSDALPLREIWSALMEHGDRYMVLADFASYVEAQERAGALFRDTRAWAAAAIRNVAAMGYFSSDRAITEYAEKVWNLKPVEVKERG